MVDWNDSRQTIDGFGGSDAFDDQIAMTSAQADLLFDPTVGIGLTYLRVGMDSTGGNQGNWTNASLAVARGAKLWAVPFTAQASQKDNASEVNGGHLLVASYDAWATTMAGFAATVKAQTGADLYAMSVQNEPDFTATYVSMVYTDAEMVAFIKVLGPKLAALTPKVKLIASEASNWTISGTTVAAILADSTAAALLDIPATHQYAGSVAPYSAGSRSVWQTEMSSFDVFDPSITNGLTVAGWIHSALTTGNVNAWHWWDLLGYVYTDNEGLIGNFADYPGPVATLTKRLYVLGQYSKFVRPGHVRCGTTAAPAGVSLTAFRNLVTGTYSLVVINTNGTPTAIRVRMLNERTNNAAITYVTSSTQDMANTGATAVALGALSATLPASSVTTFVGELR